MVIIAIGHRLTKVLLAFQLADIFMIHAVSAFDTMIAALSADLGNLCEADCSGQCLQKYANSPQAIGKLRSYSQKDCSQSNTKILTISFRRHVLAWTVSKYLNESCVVLSFEYISKAVSFRSTGHTHMMERNII